MQAVRIDADGVVTAMPAQARKRQAGDAGWQAGRTARHQPSLFPMQARPAMQQTLQE